MYVFRFQHNPVSGFILQVLWLTLPASLRLFKIAPSDFVALRASIAVYLAPTPPHARTDGASWLL